MYAKHAFIMLENGEKYSTSIVGFPSALKGI